MSALSPWRRFSTTFTIAAILYLPSVCLASTSGAEFPNPSAGVSGVVRSAAAAAVIAAEGLLIGALLLQRARRRRAELELRQTNERNRHLAGRLIASQEAERQRIARELHDDLSQKLALLKVDLEQLRSTNAATVSEIDAKVKTISDQTTEIAGEVRRLSHQLHPARLQALGLVAAVDAVCRDTGRQHGIAVEFRHNEIPRQVDPELALCVYRITQEALQNVVKHSGATRASVGLRHDGGDLALQIEDSGSGFARPDGRHAGLGLVSMRERVTFLKGTIAIHSVPGEGTRINVCVPCPEALLRPRRAAAQSA